MPWDTLFTVMLIVMKMIKKFLVFNYSIKKTQNLICILCQLNLSNTYFLFILYPF
jgi:hypothetical protein